jgi:hypothetical protein
MLSQKGPPENRVPEMGQSRLGRARSKFGHVRYSPVSDRTAHNSKIDAKGQTQRSSLPLTNEKAVLSGPFSV